MKNPRKTLDKPAGLHRRGRRNGAVMVEMAFVVVILLSLSLGLIQWGMIMNTSIAVTNLSREGARYAAVHHDTDEDIIEYVKTDADRNGIKRDNIDVAVFPAVGSADRVAGKAITVTVTYDMTKKLFLPQSFFNATFFSGTYKAQGLMMME